MEESLTGMKRPGALIKQAHTPTKNDQVQTRINKLVGYAIQR
jgi:hypothetical protein